MRFRFSGAFKNYVNRHFRVGRPDEIRLDGEDLAGLYNPYYARLSLVFGISALAISALLVLFVVFAVLLNIRDVTYENLYYFFKDFDSVISSDDFQPESITYSYEEKRVFAGYKGGLVTAGRSSLSVFSATGRKTKTFYNGYTNPIVKTSEKYILAYDAGGNELSIYNSFARLALETFDRPILAADVADDGSFIVLTAKGAGSVIYRYSGRLKRIAIYEYPEFITAVSLSADGRNLAVSYADTENGEIVSVTEIYAGLSEDPAYMFTEKRGIVLSCRVMNTAPFSGRINYCSASSAGAAAGTVTQMTSEVVFDSGETILDVSCDDEGMAVLSSDKNGYLLYILPYQGDKIAIRLDSKPNAFLKSGNFTYVLTETSLLRYNIKAGTVKAVPVSDGAEDIVFSDGGYLFVCYPSRAVSVSF